MLRLWFKNFDVNDWNVNLMTSILLQTETASYFVASKHKLSVFFALIFRFSSCQHPLLASALAKMAQDDSNRPVIGKDEGALRQLLSMMLSDNPHVVGYAIPEYQSTSAVEIRCSSSCCGQVKA